MNDDSPELVGERDRAIDLGGCFIGRTCDPAEGGIVAAEYDMEAPQAQSIERGRLARLDRLGERVVFERVRVGPKDRGTVGEHVDLLGRDLRAASYVGDATNSSAQAGAVPAATTNLRRRLLHHHLIRRRSHRRCPNSTAQLRRTLLRS